MRLFCEPVKEIESLHQKSYSWSNLTTEEANEKLKEVKGDLFHLKMDAEIVHGLGLELLLPG